VTRIPIFPLPLVLFPETHLPLHIFEPRYKQMIRECLGQAAEFGVVFANEQRLAKVGCSAEIVEVTKEYPDGRMDIAVQGRRVFEIVEVFDEKPYYEASVRYVEDTAAPETAAVPAGLLEAYQRCHQLLFGSPADEVDRHETPLLAFFIAESLPLDLEDRQSLLMLRDERERFEKLLPMLLALIPRAERKQRLRRRAAGNGHARD